MAYDYQLGPDGQRPDKPTISSPQYSAHVIDNTPTFTFIVPSDPQGDKLVFAIEVANNKDFTSPISIESRLSGPGLNDNGYWEYDSTGSNDFVTLPASGILASSFAGRKVKASFPPNRRLSTGKYYWRVLVSDNSVFPIYINQFVLNQLKIGPSNLLP